MPDRKARFAGTLALVLLAATLLASPAPGLAEVKVDMKIQMLNHAPEVFRGEVFKVRATMTYSGVPQDMSLVISLTDFSGGRHFPRGSSASRPANKGMSGTGLCSGSFTCDFDVRFDDIDPEDEYDILASGYIKDAQARIVTVNGDDLDVKCLPKPILSITKVDAVRPPDSITTMETMPVVVHLTYKKMPADYTLGVVIEDQDGKGTLASWTSRRLTGAGSLISDPIKIRLTESKTWNLAAKASAAGGFSADQKTFQVKVVSGVTIARIQRPEGTIRLSEQASLVVTIDYEGLPAVGQALMAIVSNKDTNAKLGSSTSTRLAGNGSFTFRPIAVKPSQKGDWNLKVEITDLGSNVITGKWLTIKVVQ